MGLVYVSVNTVEFSKYHTTLTNLKVNNCIIHVYVGHPSGATSLIT